MKGEKVNYQAKVEVD